MHAIIKRIATGPHLSKDISFAESRAAIKAILTGHVSPVQAAIFLIALRMKRESTEENTGILQGIIDIAGHTVADVDEVLDIADPYNGWNRGLPVAAFLPVVMAALEVPSLIHGLKSVGPKYGATHHLVLREAGKQVDMTAQQAGKQIAGDAGWAYLDQSIYCPLLHKMTDFRKAIVKRTVITTVEVLIGPVRGRKATHIMTGYVHKVYPPLYAALARQSRFASALIIRGVEGGVIPSLQQSAKLFYYHDFNQEQDILLDPVSLGVKQDTRCVELPAHIEKVKGGGSSSPEQALAIAQQAAEVGLQALQGKSGAAFDSLVYGASIALWHLRPSLNITDAATQVRQVLKNGKAAAHFDAGS